MAGTASGGEGRRQVRRGEQQPGGAGLPRPSPSARRGPALPRRPEADGRAAGGGGARRPLRAETEGFAGRGLHARRSRSRAGFPGRWAGQGAGRELPRPRSGQLAGGGPGASLSPHSGAPAPRQVLPGRLPPALIAGSGRGRSPLLGGGPGVSELSPSPLTQRSPVCVRPRKQARKVVVFAAILTVFRTVVGKQRG